MNNQQSLIAKLLQNHSARKYSEGGEAGRREINDQVEGPQPKQKNRFLKGLADVGKWGLNTLATPLEAVMGWDFYDPTFSDTGFGNTVGKVNKVTSGVVSGATNIAGTMLGGPAFNAMKSTATQLGDTLGLEDQVSGQVFKQGGNVKSYANGGPPSFLDEKFQEGWAGPKPQGPYDPVNPPWGFSANPGAGVRPGAGFQTTFPAGPSSNPSDAPKQRAPNTLGGMGGIEQQQLLGNTTKNNISRLYHSNPNITMESESISPLDAMQGGFSDTWSAVNAQRMDNPNPDITSDPASRVRPTSMSIEEENAIRGSDPSYRRDETGKQTGTPGKMYNSPKEPELPTKGRLDRWKDQFKTSSTNSDFMSALIGTDRDSSALGNKNQAAGIGDAITKLQGDTANITKQKEDYAKKVDILDRPVTAYGHDGVSAGIVGNEDPQKQMKLNALTKPATRDPWTKIGQGLAMAGDIASKGMSGFSGGEGPDWAKFLGEGKGTTDDIPKADMGGSIGSSYGGVNAGFLDIRSKKHKSGGHSYREGSIVEKEGDTTLPITPEGIIDVPTQFEGYFTVPGALHSEMNAFGGTGQLISVPAKADLSQDIPMMADGGEAENKQIIEAERGEGVKVANGETYIIPRNRKKEFDKFQAKEDRYTKILEDDKKNDGKNDKEKLDSIQIASINKMRHNAITEQTAMKAEITDAKEKKEGIPNQGMMAGLMQDQGVTPQAARGGEIEQYQEGSLIPGAMYLNAYAQGRKNTKDWYDRVNTGDLQPVNHYEGVLDESINHYQNALDTNLPASQAAITANLQKQLNAMNANTKETTSGSSIADARLRQTFATGAGKQADIAKLYGDLGLQYDTKIANLKGDNAKLNAAGLEKKDETNRVLWGDYATATGEDIDELPASLAHMQKNRAQEMLNKMLAAQLTDGQEGIGEESKIKVEEKTKPPLAQSLGVPVPEDSDFSVVSDNDLIQEQIKKTILENDGDEVSIDEIEEEIITPEDKEKRRREIEEEVYNTSAEGIEMQEKADEAAAIENKILKERYGIESDEWKRKVGEVPIPGEDEYPAGISDNDLIREETVLEQIKRDEINSAQDEINSEQDIAEINKEIAGITGDDQLSDEELQRLAEKDNQLAAGVSEVVEMDKLEPEVETTGLTDKQGNQISLSGDPDPDPVDLPKAGDSTATTEKLVWRENLSKDEQGYVDRITIQGSVGPGVANILRDGQPITAQAGPFGSVTVKGVEAIGDGLVIRTNLGDKNMGEFKKVKDGFKFEKGAVYKYLKGEDKKLFDSFVKAAESDEAFANQIRESVRGDIDYNSSIL